mgnify:CR=1 FL=1
MDYKAIEDAANAVAEALDARVIVYSGGINKQGYGQLLQAVRLSEGQPSRPNSLMILTTSGGLADAAYQIARLLQNVSEKFYLCVPNRCKSAGTLIALGANELMMTPLSELGPLDVQLHQRDEIGERRSGLVVRAAFEGLARETFDVWQQFLLGIKTGSQGTVSFEVASRIAADVATGVMSPVYAQINPDVLGNDLRDLNVAEAYGARLIKNGENADINTVNELVASYPAHGFVIDRDEAKELFRVVNEPSVEVSMLIRALGPVVYIEQDPQIIKRLDSLPEEPIDESNDDETESEPGDASVDDRSRPVRSSDRSSKRTGRKSTKAVAPESES